MLKSWIISIAIVLVLAGAYYSNLFGWLASSGALITAIILVLAAIAAALKILGSPFRKVDDDDDSEEKH